MKEHTASFTQFFLPRANFATLLLCLQRRGYQIVGPQLRDHAIVYDVLQSVSDLPQGVTVVQEPGRYTVTHGMSERFFAWANGPQALKPLLFTPRETLWRVRRDENGALQFVAETASMPPTAVIGVRACDLAALRVHDRVLLKSAEPDPHYAARRAQLFLIAVNCSDPASTCFCASTGDGPHADAGFDMALTELDDGFTVQAGNALGQTIVDELSLNLASDAHHFAVGQQRERASQVQTRSLPSVARRLRLMEQLEHPRWQEVAERCLSCGNCTQVCPTCFCHKQSTENDLATAESEQVREWDSCFSQQHSYIHGTTMRGDTRARYRQWLTHKLATWHEQFDMSGCVGCGRCIAWCPVGIDLTVETTAMVGELSS